MIVDKDLERRTVKPPVLKIMKGGKLRMYVCPACGLCDHIEGREVFRPERYRIYCSRCGQKLREDCK